jgi:hypothetical protein
MRLGLHQLQFWDLSDETRRAVEKWSRGFRADPYMWVACVELLNETGTHVILYTVASHNGTGNINGKEHARALLEKYADRIYSKEYKDCSPFPTEAIRVLPDDLFALEHLVLL